MKQLRELRKNIIKNPEFSQALINSFIKICNDQDQINLLSAVKDIRWTAVAMILAVYLEEKESRSVYDIIQSKDSCMFEFDNETYQFAGIEDGVAKFRKLGSMDIINPPFKLEDKVNKIF